MTDAALTTLAGRKRAEDRIDAALAEWTRERDAHEIEAELQRAGVAAHALLDTHELASDAQLDVARLYPPHRASRNSA